MFVTGPRDIADANDDWSVNEKVLQEMKDSYRQVRHSKDRKSPAASSRIAISDSQCSVIV